MAGALTKIRTLAVIPARSGTKDLKDKNIRQLWCLPKITKALSNRWSFVYA